MIPVASVVTITRDGGSVIVGFAESEDPDAGHLLLMRGPATEADGRTGTDSHCVVVGPATHHGGIESWTLTGHGEITGQALELTLTTEAASTLSLDRRVRVMLSRPPPPNLDATLRHVIDGAPVETLYRPTGEVELRLVAEADWLAWPPRLPEQPIFYPVTNEEYAVQIARDWNAAADTTGYVTAFAVERAFLAPLDRKVVGDSRTHVEYWVPADELDDFNRHLVGPIRVLRAFRGDPPVEIDLGRA